MKTTYPQCGRYGLDIIESLPAGCPIGERPPVCETMSGRLDAAITDAIYGDENDVDALRFYMNTCYVCACTLRDRPHAAHIARLRRKAVSQ